MCKHGFAAKTPGVPADSSCDHATANALPTTHAVRRSASEHEVRRRGSFRRAPHCRWLAAAMLTWRSTEARDVASGAVRRTAAHVQRARASPVELNTEAPAGHGD